MADLVNAILEFLKLNGTITDLEKDILDTAFELRRYPFSHKDAQNKISENDFKYPDIALAVRRTPGTVCKPFSKCSEEDMKNALMNQLIKLCEKEDEELKKRAGQD